MDLWQMLWLWVRPIASRPTSEVKRSDCFLWRWRNIDAFGRFNDYQPISNSSKIIIFNNRVLGMVKLEMRVEGYVDWQTIWLILFCKIGQIHKHRSMGSQRIQRCGISTHKRIQTQWPAIITIFTDPNPLAMPPSLTFEQVEGFAESKEKMMLNGQFAKIVDTIKSDLKYIRELL